MFHKGSGELTFLSLTSYVGEKTGLTGERNKFNKGGGWADRLIGRGFEES